MKNVPVIPMKGLCLASKLGFSFLYYLAHRLDHCYPTKNHLPFIKWFWPGSFKLPTQTPVPLLISLLSTRLALLTKAINCSYVHHGKSFANHLKLSLFKCSFSSCIFSLLWLVLLVYLVCGQNNFVCPLNNYVVLIDLAVTWCILHSIACFKTMS